MKVLRKSYILFWITSISILIDGFLIQNPESVADVNVHDTYYVIAHGLISEIFSLIFFILGLGYWILEKLHRDLNQCLTIIHIVGTVGIAWLYKIILVGFNFLELKNLELINEFMLISFSLAFLVQPIYIVNIITAIVKPKARQ